jgi:hypothetical protein
MHSHVLQYTGTLYTDYLKAVVISQRPYLSSSSLLNKIERVALPLEETKK